MANCATIGVDLAAQAKETAACVLVWREPCATVSLLASGLDDDAVVELVAQHAPTKVAIDAPFGWPIPFVDAVARYESTGDWTGSDVAALRLRTTDRRVIAETQQQPLSVSSDRIAITAMRCARLLTRLAAAGYDVPRDGGGLVAEVYPAAALRAWGLDPKGYKGTKPEQVAKRALLADRVTADTAEWLKLSEHDRESIAASDHLLDALVCAVLARAVTVGATRPIADAERDRARIEGWIHLPMPARLADTFL